MRAEIGADGAVSIEFVGFEGELCAEERDRLRGALEALGILIEPERIKRKSPQQIASEVSTSTQGPRSELGPGC